MIVAKGKRGRFNSGWLWLAILWLGFLLSTSSLMAANCGEFCSDNTDCTGTCAYCDGGANCADCCDLPDQDSCGLNPGCIWSTSECRNGTTPCGVVRELPWPFKYYFFGGLFLFSLAGSLLLVRSRSSNADQSNKS